MAEVKSGLNIDRLKHLKWVMEEDAKQDLYFGGVIIVARHGEIGIHEAFGHANSEKQRLVEKDSVFSLFSVTKAYNNVLIYRAMERGQFALTTKVADVIPEFKGGLRERINVFDLLTHSSGLPSIYIPKHGMYVDRLDEMVQAICELVQSEVAPGERVDYSPLCSHALVAEMVVRTDPKGRSWTQICNEEIIEPLKLKDTSVGLRRDLRERHIRPEFRGDFPTQHLGRSNLGPNGAFEEEHAEMPWVGIAATAFDLFRFAEMLRRGGELDGERILSPSMIKLGTKNWTGEKPNEVYRRLASQRGWPVIPAYIGLGFPLRGEKIGNHLYGTMTTPNTFGAYGAGTTLFWVDPELDMTFVALTTGVMENGANYLRWRRLSDIAASAAV